MKTRNFTKNVKDPCRCDYVAGDCINAMIKKAMNVDDESSQKRFREGLGKAIQESVELLKERALELSRTLAKKSNPKVIQSSKAGS